MLALMTCRSDSKKGGVGGASDRGAGTFEEGGLKLAAAVVASDQIAHILAGRSVAAFADP